MHVLVLAPSRHDTSPSQRYRIEQWMPHLERRGVRFSFDAFASDALHRVLYQRGRALEKAALLVGDFLRRAARLLAARRFDAVFLHREAALLGPALLERLVDALGVPIVYEFDDAIWIPYVSPTNGYLARLKFPEKTATICRLASHVLVGNELLRDYATGHNRNVTIVPSTIDTDAYDGPPRYRPEGLPVIGWSGSHSSLRYLEALRPALVALHRRRPFRLDVIGHAGSQFRIDEVPFRLRTWSSATEVADLRPFDIGIMPLSDDPWSRGKCALKALQYMALGIPTVVSPVGANARVILDGENGLHATTDEAWIEQLTRLLDDEQLRRRLGEAGRRTVIEGYSARVHAPRVLAVLESVARGRAAS